MTRISEKPWSEFSQADYPDADTYCSACLLDTNEAGTEKAKEQCHLPVYEPGGALNRNGVHAAAARLAGAGRGVKLSTADQKRAAKKLVALYQHELKEEPPESIAKLAQH